MTFKLTNKTKTMNKEILSADVPRYLGGGWTFYSEEEEQAYRMYIAKKQRQLAPTPSKEKLDDAGDKVTPAPSTTPSIKQAEKTEYHYRVGGVEKTIFVSAADYSALSAFEGKRGAKPKAFWQLISDNGGPIPSKGMITEKNIRPAPAPKPAANGTESEIERLTREIEALKALRAQKQAPQPQSADYSRADEYNRALSSLKEATAKSPDSNFAKATRSVLKAINENKQGFWIAVSPATVGQESAFATTNKQVPALAGAMMMLNVFTSVNHPGVRMIESGLPVLQTLQALQALGVSACAYAWSSGWQFKLSVVVSEKVFAQMQAAKTSIQA